MRFPIKTLLVTLVALLLAVPTGAMAKGKPSWAGQGNSGGHGKPAWAGKGHGKADKADKAKAAHEKKAKKEKGNKHQAEAAGEEDENDPDELSLEDLAALEDISAPGQYCHALESMQDSLAGVFGGESFDEHFGENDNLANSFGKCASWRAQGGELSEEAAEEEPAEESCEPSEEEGAEEEASEEEGTSEEPAGDEPAEGDEATEDECEDEEPAAEEPAEEDDEESQDEESEDEESEDQSFTMTVTVEVDLSFLRA
jgi:hypothetical protein